MRTRRGAAAAAAPEQAPPPPASTPASTIAKIAKDSLDATGGGDVQAATKHMAARIRADRALRDALTDPLIDVACYDAVSGVIRKERRVVWMAPEVTSDTGARIIQLASGNAASLMDFPLPGGKKLGDATRAEVSAAAEFYRRQAVDMSSKAVWLRFVAQSVPENQRVSEAMTSERLIELRDRAEGRAEEQE